jgi:TonB family protein
MYRHNKNNSTLKMLAVVLPVAVLVHLLLLWFGGLMADWLGWGKPDRDLTYRQFNITLEKKMEKPETESDRRVVDIAPPKQEQAPKKSDFVSEFDSKVKKQTQSKHKRLADQVSRQESSPQQPQPAVRTPSKKPDDQKTPDQVEKKLTRPSALSMRRRPQPRRPGMEIEPSPRKKDVKSGQPEEEKGAEKKKKQLKVADLRLSDKALSKAIGAPFPDYLDNVPEGDKTLLNTKRWRFASFFNRVKRAVAQQWHPGRVYRRHDPTGNIYGFRSRLTVLKITLNKNGSIAKVVLKKPCGLSFLDNEATRAFKAAGPFPNPPRRLINKKSGKITFSFGFLFEIMRGPNFRIFRYK